MFGLKKKRVLDTHYWRLGHFLSCLPSQSEKMVRAASWHYAEHNLFWSYCCQIKDLGNKRLELLCKSKFQKFVYVLAYKMSYVKLTSPIFIYMLSLEPRIMLDPKKVQFRFAEASQRPKYENVNKGPHAIWCWDTKFFTKFQSWFLTYSIIPQNISHVGQTKKKWEQFVTLKNRYQKRPKSRPKSVEGL